jgi:glyoxylase-like metal-dependent hydrolase (beta-lactamase superfamily II)
MLRSSSVRALSSALAVMSLLAAYPGMAGAGQDTSAERAAAAEPGNAAAFKIGELTAVALRDGELEFPNDNQVFGVGRTPGDVAALLESAGVAADKLRLDVHPLLVKTPDRVLLFDTGAGSNFGPTAGHLAASLAAARVEPQDVTDVFISHVHGDHVGGLVTGDGKPAFPNAVIHVAKPDWEYLSGMSVEKARNNGIEQHAVLVAAMEPKIDAFAPGAELVPGIVQAVDVKGHSPGHSAYRITSGQHSLLYVGDTVHHHVVSVQKPDWPNGFDGDPKTAAASRAALIAESAASGERIYAVHFPFPGIGRFAKQGEGYAWAAE